MQISRESKYSGNVNFLPPGSGEDESISQYSPERAKYATKARRKSENPFLILSCNEIIHSGQRSLI